MAGILKHLCGVQKPRVLVFGITGRQGSSRSRLMAGYGTDIVAGCTPGKGGQQVNGVPVYDSALEAVKTHPGINSAVFFVPASALASAAFEAMDAGIGFLVLTADGVATHDSIRLKEKAAECGAKCLGPNTVGMLDTEGYLFGLIGGSAAWARRNYLPGCVGVISRSGGLSQLLGAFHCRKHIPGPRPDGSFGPLWGEDYPGLSAVLCTGGDPVPGITLLDAAIAFEKDPRTRVTAVYAETGTTQENDLAAAVASGELRKPMVVFLGGRFTRAGVAQSHAGAMIRNESESYQVKRRELENAGIMVVDRPDAVFAATAELLGK